MSVPIQKPGRSRQDYGTPPEFLVAVVARFGPLAFDLAASRDNAVVAPYFTVDDDALSQSWSELRGVLWLNPPFADIEPWARKCSESCGQHRILLLTPASIGTEWFAKYVHRKALVLGLRPRMTFAGCADPYPKDLIISVYGVEPGFDTWRWK